MEFNVFTIVRKKGNIRQVHTPSCPHNHVLKKRWAWFKISTAYVEDAKEQAAASGLPVMVHPKCCHLFRKPVTTHPPCPHCAGTDTVLRGKLSPGHYEYTCKSCHKTYVHKQERIMKVKISKSGKDLKATQKKEARAAARQARREARMQKRAERKTRRAGRLAMRLYRSISRLGLLVDLDGPIVDAFLNELAAKTATTNPVTGTPAAPATKKTRAAKKAKTPAKKTPLKKVAYAPNTNQPAMPKAAAKKTARKK